MNAFSMPHLVRGAPLRELFLRELFLLSSSLPFSPPLRELRRAEKMFVRMDLQICGLCFLGITFSSITVISVCRFRQDAYVSAQHYLPLVFLAGGAESSAAPNKHII